MSTDPIRVPLLNLTKVKFETGDDISSRKWVQQMSSRRTDVNWKDEVMNAYRSEQPDDTQCQLNTGVDDE